MLRRLHGVEVHGVDVDAETRCAHYHSELDIIAIRFRCCGRWFPCHACHAASTEHEPLVWSIDERDTQAILCGGCGHQLTIAAYLASGSRCPSCRRSFNPGCTRHSHLYFETASSEEADESGGNQEPTAAGAHDQWTRPGVNASPSSSQPWARTKK